MILRVSDREGKPLPVARITFIPLRLILYIQLPRKTAFGRGPTFAGRSMGGNGRKTRRHALHPKTPPPCKVHPATGGPRWHSQVQTWERGSKNCALPQPRNGVSPGVCIPKPSVLERGRIFVFRRRSAFHAQRPSGHSAAEGALPGLSANRTQMTAIMLTR